MITPLHRNTLGLQFANTLIAAAALALVTTLDAQESLQKAAEGAGTDWIWHHMDADYDDAQHLIGVDLDLDGDEDLIGAGDGADITFYRNLTGDGDDWDRIIVTTNFNGPYSVGAGDLDGDGDLDLAAVARVGANVSWFENTAGDGSAWTDHEIETYFQGTEDLVIDDIDGRGIRIP